MTLSGDIPDLLPQKAKLFSVAGSFKVGEGSTHNGLLKHVKDGVPGFVRHPTQNTGVCLTPVDTQLARKTITPLQYRLYQLAKTVLEKVDHPYAQGEFVVQFGACMDSSSNLGSIILLALCSPPRTTCCTRAQPT